MWMKGGWNRSRRSFLLTHIGRNGGKVCRVEERGCAWGEEEGRIEVGKNHVFDVRFLANDNRPYRDFLWGCKLESLVSKDLSHKGFGVDPRKLRPLKCRKVSCPSNLQPQLWRLRSYNLHRIKAWDLESGSSFKFSFWPIWFHGIWSNKGAVAVVKATKG